MVVAWIPMGLSLLLLIAGFKAYRPGKGICPNCRKKGTLQNKVDYPSDNLEDSILDESLIQEKDVWVCSNCSYVVKKS